MSKKLVAYFSATGTTKRAASVFAKAADADLFVCEGMYGEPDKLEKAKEHKHMTFYEAAEMARDANVKELWLTHYSPSLIHPEEFKDDVKKIFKNTVVSRDGRSTDLCFTEE